MLPPVYLAVAKEEPDRPSSSPRPLLQYQRSVPAVNAAVERQPWSGPWVVGAPFALFFLVLIIIAASTPPQETTTTAAYRMALYGASARQVDHATPAIVYQSAPPTTMQSLQEFMCVGKTRPSFNIHAPMQSGVDALGVMYNTQQRGPFRALESNSYAEVTHCGGSAFEPNASWHYVMPGSSLFVNLSRTIAFETHEDAAQFFLGKRCAARFNVDHRWNPQCDDEIPSIMSTARRLGYSSIQFTHHCDAYCGACGHELVMLGHSGRDACPLGLQYYSAPDTPCDCVPWGRSMRGACAMCSNTSIALDSMASPGSWPTLAPAADDSWKRACNLEAGRHVDLARVNVSECKRTGSMDACLTSLRQTIQARGVLANRSRVKRISDEEFDVCLEADGSRFCEVGFRADGSPILKKACRVPSTCLRFHLATIRGWASAMGSDTKRWQTCTIAMRGHALACSQIPKERGHVIVYGHEGYSWWDSTWLWFSALRNRAVFDMIGTSHSGGVLLTYALASCETLHVHGMGLYSNTSDVVYQHYYDARLVDRCPSTCWDGESVLPNTTQADRQFFQEFSHDVCRPRKHCTASQSSSIPRSENQVDFFVKSELKLHLLHALGILRWEL